MKFNALLSKIIKCKHYKRFTRNQNNRNIGKAHYKDIECVGISGKEDETIENIVHTNKVHDIIQYKASNERRLK